MTESAPHLRMIAGEMPADIPSMDLAVPAEFSVRFDPSIHNGDDRPARRSRRLFAAVHRRSPKQ